MKNIAIASALTLGSVSSFASAFQTTFFHDGIMDIVFQEDFTPIEIENLPTAIIDAVLKNYGEDKIGKAHKNELKEYKLELRVNNETQVVYTDEDGHWISK
ncbi:hypothetical protein [uncultured Formosa sp.]|uniref:hypothetical protein n=1 Tax=uncultured Formosa sp. TaxID=255435 RepID=UPI002622E67B|nr:hypothetical protein [uncultured Formosa sp.]